MSDAPTLSSPIVAFATAGCAAAAVYMLGKLAAGPDTAAIAREIRRQDEQEYRGQRHRGNHQSSPGEWSPLYASGDAEDTTGRQLSINSSRRHQKSIQNQPTELTQKVAKAILDRGLEGEWQGFSMEDARKHSDLAATKAAARSPKDVLRELQRGNARFWMGVSTRPEVSAFERRALIMQQYPSVAILGCSDSRVPIEIVFDQGLGDMFVIRVAGNCLDTTTTASLQYAVQHLHVKLIVVMGHEGCGAVKAAQLPQKDIEGEPRQLSDMLMKMKGGLEQSRLDHVYDPRARDRETVVTNVRAQLDGLTEDQSIMSKVESKDLVLVGAFYEISSGIVDFFDEVSANDEPAVPGVSRPGRMKSNARYVGSQAQTSSVDA